MLAFACAVVLLLVMLNGVFAMSELAVVSSRRAKLQARADKGDRGAKAALTLSKNPNRFLSAVQVGITLIGILAGAYGQATIAAELDARFMTIPLIAEYAEPIATGIVVVVLTYLSLIVGELVPKRIAMLFPEAIAGVVAAPLSLMARLMGPFVTLLTASTAGVLKLMGIKETGSAAITHEEVETILAEGAHAGLIEPAEQAMMNEIMRLGDRPVRTAMTPRKDVYWVSLDDAPDQIRAEMRACPYSRFLVARGSSVDEPLGVVHKKDVLDVLLDNQVPDLEALLATPLYLPENTPLLRALELLKKSPTHMALVVDEFGALEGVVTAIDLLEMIAGDFDEGHDSHTSASIIERADGSLLVDGRAHIDDLNKVLGVDFGADGSFHTVAGLVLHVLARFPAEGEVFQIGPYKAEVVDMDERRIDKLLIYRPDSAGD